MKKYFLNGILKENPILILMIGLCPVLVCSTSANAAIGMGISATFVLVCSNVIISSIRKLIPRQVRIPIFIVVIATFVTIVDYFLKAYFPELSKTLGVAIPMIVVNCIMLARAEAFAYKNTLVASFLDGLGMGIGFTLVILITGCIREFFGNGTIFSSEKILLTPAVMFILPGGAFVTLGLIVSFVRYLQNKFSSQQKPLSPCSTCTLAKLCFPGREK